MENQQDIKDILVKMDKRLQRLDTAIMGDDAMGTNGMVHRMRHFEGALDEHEKLDRERFAEIKSTHQLQNEKIEDVEDRVIDLVSQSKGVKVFMAIAAGLLVLLSIYKGFKDVPFRVDLGFGTPFEQLL